MSLIRKVKDLIPLPIRFLLKGQGFKKPEQEPPPGKWISCPICGTVGKTVGFDGNMCCAGCGSTQAHRRLTLSVHAYIKTQKPRRILAVGSDPMLRTLSEDVDNVEFADDPLQIPLDSSDQFDLCIHSHWIETYPAGPEAGLEAINCLLSPIGRQIFTTNLASPRWRRVKSAMTKQILMEWLKKKRYRPSLFDPDEAFGVKSSDLFGCEEKGSEIVVIVPRMQKTPP